MVDAGQPPSLTGLVEGLRAALPPLLPRLLRRLAGSETLRGFAEIVRELLPEDAAKRRRGVRACQDQIASHRCAQSNASTRRVEERARPPKRQRRAEAEVGPGPKHMGPCP